MTLGEFRKLTEHLPDDAPIVWETRRRLRELDCCTDITVKAGKVVIDAAQFQEEPE